MKKLIAAAAGASPFLALAQSSGMPGENLSELIQAVAGIVADLLPLLVAIALLVFFWGLVKFILYRQDKMLMVWGIVALAVMVLVWGLVRWLGNAFGIDDSNTAAPDVSEILPPGLED